MVATHDSLTVTRRYGKPNPQFLGIPINSEHITLKVCLYLIGNWDYCSYYYTLQYFLM